MDEEFKVKIVETLQHLTLAVAELAAVHTLETGMDGSARSAHWQTVDEVRKSFADDLIIVNSNIQNLREILANG